MIGLKIQEASDVGAEPGLCCDWCILVVIIFGGGVGSFPGGSLYK